MENLNCSDVNSCNEDSAGDMPIIPEKMNRLIKKRRPQSSSFSYAGQSGSQFNALISPAEMISTELQKVSLNNNKLPYSKNSRKSRQGSRSTHKKNNSRDIMFLKYDELGELSPEYESDGFDVGYEKEEIDKDMVEDRICDLLVEFYSHVNFSEFLSSLKELNIPGYMRNLIPLFLINFAMQHRSIECEFTSELLVYLHKKFISSLQMIEGFHIVLGEMPDIILDVPKAPEFIGRFIARAIADKILPHKYLVMVQDQDVFDGEVVSTPDEIRGKTNIRSNSGGSDSFALNSISSSAYGSQATSLNSNDALMKSIEIAEKILSLNESFSRLDDIWGEKSGQRANRFLVYKFQLLIKKYTSNKDISSVYDGLLDLKSPYFHHELVYQIIMSCMESNNDPEEVANLIKLLKNLCSSVTVTKDQLELGVKRVFSEMPLIDKEMPCAYIVLNRLMRKIFEADVISDKIFRTIPVKNGRKRFVSEGDFLIKSNLTA